MRDGRFRHDVLSPRQPTSLVAWSALKGPRPGSLSLSLSFSPSLHLSFSPSLLLSFSPSLLLSFSPSLLLFLPLPPSSSLFLPLSLTLPLSSSLFLSFPLSSSLPSLSFSRSYSLSHSLPLSVQQWSRNAAPMYTVGVQAAIGQSGSTNVELEYRYVNHSHV